jgi:preprotein translocase subunit SecE
MANNKFVGYIKESYDELMHKVSWPTWSELQNSAVVVSVASLIIALVVFMMDKSFEIILEQFYTLF